MDDECPVTLGQDGSPLTGDPASPDVRRLIAMLHPDQDLRPEWADLA